MDTGNNPDQQIPSRFGRYEIEAEIGRGGMATVYRARDPRFGRVVAIKVLPHELLHNPMLRARFEREAQTIARLEHSAIVPVHDFGEENSQLYLVMRYMTGGSLEERIASGPLSLAQTVKILERIAPALDEAHQRGIIHRDLKPGNILFDQNGDPYIADFGIVKLGEGTTLTGTGGVVGTPAYMSPEQGRGDDDIDARSDIYSLGAILFQMLTGKLPFESTTPTGMIIKHITDPIPNVLQYRPDLPYEIQGVIERAMAKRKEIRYPTAVAMTLDITRLLSKIPTKESNKVTQTMPEAVSRPVSPTAALPPVQAETMPAFKQADQETVAVVTPAPAAGKPSRIPSWCLPVSLVALTLLVFGAAGGVYGIIKAIQSTQYPPTVQPTAFAAIPPTPAEVVEAPTKGPTSIRPSAVPVSKIKVGLVTDVGGVNDKSFNQSAWAGVQKAAAEFGLEARYIESKQPTDYEKNIDQFASENYDVIITVGFLMGDATAAKAKQYPNIKFGMIDYSYTPIKDSTICPDTVKDCYSDGGLKNVTSLMFQEDQVGFLAGVLAAEMTKTDVICSVAGMQIPPVERYVVGYQNGAKWANDQVKALNVYIPSFSDPAKGKETGISMISQNCDVIFGVGGNTGNGGLLAAKENGLMAIGVDVDQYYTYPEVQAVLISSAMKNVDVAVYDYLKSVGLRTDKPGVIIANIENDGVGLAPFHDWEAKIPDEVKNKIQTAKYYLIQGIINTGYTP